MIKGERGVTLIEVMVVVAIVGLLAAIAIPAYNDYVTRSRRSNAFTALETVRAAQEMYRAENGSYASAFVSGATTVLAGCSSTMAGSDYTIAVASPTSTTFTATATPTTTGHQSKDYSFQIDYNGIEWYQSYGTTGWKSDITWDSLR
jgi:type IV pilus assembly protein PilE